jgi:DNA-binding response OmpR family regulator
MSKKILIIDDNELMIEVMTYILLNHGYEVISLTSGNEVFKKIKANNPDLIIMNALLPGITGTEICQLIKLNRTTQNLPIIICSGDEDVIEQSLNHWGGPDDVLIKPFDTHNLIEKVEYQLAA